MRSERSHVTDEHGALDDAITFRDVEVQPWITRQPSPMPRVRFVGSEVRLRVQQGKQRRKICASPTTDRHRAVRHGTHVYHKLAPRENPLRLPE
jgi:hypothetical protein